jgi:hypothetical protein
VSGTTHYCRLGEQSSQLILTRSLNQLKFLSNELRMPVIALGMSEALYAMQTDPQIASRLESMAPPRWRESAGRRVQQEFSFL